MSKKKYYIAGPMRGIPYFNFPAFHEAKLEVERFGIPVSPADIDLAMGFDPYVLPHDFDWNSLDMAAFDLRSAILRDVVALLDCQGIYLLRGWEKSKGATAEKTLAEWAGLDIRFQPR